MSLGKTILNIYAKQQKNECNEETQERKGTIKQEDDSTANTLNI